LPKIKKLTYTQFEVTLAFTGNPKMEKFDQNNKRTLAHSRRYGTKLGYGLHKKMDWIRIIVD
jgi:hypothetical protein